MRVKKLEGVLAQKEGLESTMSEYTTDAFLGDVWAAIPHSYFAHS